MASNTRKTLYISGGIALFLIFFVLIMFLTLRGTGDKSGQSVAYDDPASRQTVITQNNKAPEQTDADPTSRTEPTFAGLNALIDKGYSLPEIEATRRAFTGYKELNNVNALISLDVDSLQSGTPEESDPEGRFYVTGNFVFRLDNKNTTYKFKLYHNGTNQVQLVIYDANSQQLYDSGRITN